MGNEHIAEDFKDHDGNDIGGGGGGDLVRISGHWHGVNSTRGAFNELAADSIYFQGIKLRGTSDKVRIHVHPGGKQGGSGPAPAGSELQLGIYDSIGAGPGDLLEDLGTVATDSSGLQEAIISIDRTGEFYIGFHNDKAFSITKRFTGGSGPSPDNFIDLGTPDDGDNDSVEVLVRAVTFGTLPNPAPTDWTASPFDAIAVMLRKV